MLTRRNILVADPDPNFLQEIASDPKNEQMPAITAATGKTAQLALADRTRSFAAIFVNLELGSPPGISVVRFAHQTRPSTPIYLIQPKDSPFKDVDEKKLGIHGKLEKPFRFADIAKLIAPAAFVFDKAAALEQGKKNTETLDAEFTADEKIFVPIRAEDFFSGSKSFFDVYVRLGGDGSRYVKILQAGDSFSPDRLANYLSKGVTHFFLKKDAQEQYLAYCDQIATQLLKKSGVGLDIKLATTMNHGQETMSFLRNQGLSETNLQYAEKFVTNVQTLVEQMEPGKHELLKGFMADVAAYEHGVATSIIASLLLPVLKIEADKPVQIVGVTSLLHDIGLYRLPAETHDEDEAKMTEEQRAMYRTHPAVGAQVLKTIPGLDPSVLQAVAQHHERRNKRGFPARLGAGAINRVAEIVGIADEFVRMIKRAEANPKTSIQKEMSFEVFPGFSPIIVEAFSSVFLSTPHDKTKTPQPKRAP